MGYVIGGIPVGVGTAAGTEDVCVGLDARFTAHSRPAHCREGEERVKAG